jgi:hypothetical protein
MGKWRRHNEYVNRESMKEGLGYGREFRIRELRDKVKEL